MNTFVSSRICFGALLLGSTLHAAPLKPDADTLLYASFDERQDKADYANGWDRFGGGGYRPAEGYYGNAVDLRGVELPEDFWAVENGYLPHLTQWIFWPRGNVSFRQGTMEFWFKPAAPDQRNPVLGGGDTLHFQSFQPLRTQLNKETGKREAVQCYIRLNTTSARWKLVTLKGRVIEGRVLFKGVKDWAKHLSPDQWHHFALQWSRTGITLYLDGRPLASYALEDDFGLALTAASQRGLAMNGILMDELRISAVPRYEPLFEPNWREGARPTGAFPGVANVLALPHETRQTDLPLPNEKETGTVNAAEWKSDLWKLKANRANGALLSLAHETTDKVTAEGRGGLQLWRGVEREPLKVESMKEWKQGAESLSFTQIWQGECEVKQSITQNEKGALVWKATFTNRGTERLWLEALMALPVKSATKEFFDMSWTQRELPFPRRRDDYLFSLPFVAASDGKQGLGVGLNPKPGASALIGEWIPAEQGSEVSGGTMRQGTRVALAPGETQELEWLLVASKGEFGVKDTLAGYHALFPELYAINREAPIYSSMSVAQYFSYVNVPDATRTYYTGGQWGHGPYHTKGDYLGDPRFWGRKDLEGREDYAHALRNQKRFGSREKMFEEIVQKSKDSFLLYYTPRRSHDLPNMPARFIVDELMPGTDYADDPTVAGQYFMPKNMVVNEFNTPLGKKFIDDQIGTVKLIGRYSPGFINDFCQSSGYRFTDEAARTSAGRAFSEDRGEYLVAAFGSVERYRKVAEQVLGDRHQSTISDWGMVSYMLSAWSVANAFESGCPFVSTTGMKLGLEVSRNLLGEKPISVLTSYGLDDIGKLFAPTDFTAERLRDYYRYAHRRVMLNALDTGYYVDPPLLHGKQWNSEINPVLVESLVGGRKTTPGGRVNAPLWLVRGGDEGKSVVVVGNYKATEQKADVELYHAYFGGRYLWAPYFGGSLQQQVMEKETRLGEQLVKPHDVEAYKPVLAIEGDGEVAATVKWEGDGLALRTAAQIEAKSAQKVTVLLPAEYYSIASVQINGKPASVSEEGVISVPAGKSELIVELRNDVLRFSSEAWAKVDLIAKDAPNFCLIAATGIGYERGTAQQLNWFLIQYDEEDGVLNNLNEAAVYASEESVPKDFKGWRIDLRPDAAAKAPEVTLSPEERLIRIAGATPGEVRRAMMLFMRMIDRKYPHIGRHVPMDRNLSGGWSNPDWSAAYNPKEPGWKRLYGSRRPETLKFFENFEDRDFLVKPILEKEHEALYANGNVNFQNKYNLRFSPHLLEPTFAEDYIYGYTGPREEP